MTSENCWVPDLEPYESIYPWVEYENYLYSIFEEDFINDHPIFEGKRVNIRKYPLYNEKEDAFYHVTCQDFFKKQNRDPDLRRCERIRWIRAFIENYNCDPKLCDSCDGIKVWSEPYHNTTRVHLLLEEERYIVVLERRSSYILLITAYYIEHEHTLAKKVKKYREQCS